MTARKRAEEIEKMNYKVMWYTMLQYLICKKQQEPGLTRECFAEALDTMLDIDISEFSKSMMTEAGDGIFS